MIKRTLLALSFLAAAPALAEAQSFPGVFPADTIYCNPTSSAAAPQACSAAGLVGSQKITAQTSPTNGTYFAPNSGAVNWCPAWPGGCSNGTAGGTWTTQLLTASTTAGPPSQQESQIFGILFANTGFYNVWAASTSYTSGTYAVNGSDMYQETVASCTSAGSGGPTGTGSGITDNTCSWNYVAPNFAGGKQVANFNVVGGAGGGHIWGSTSTATTLSGWNAQFAAGAEIDAGNSSSVTTTFGTPGASQIYNLYLGGVNANPITAALYISPQGTASPGSAQYGIILNGSNAFSSAAIYNNSTGASNGYYDTGTETNGINLAGTYSNSAITASGPIYISTGASNANLYLSTTGQQWNIVGNVGSAFSIFDSTHSASVFSIAPTNGTLTLGSAYTSCTGFTSNASHVLACTASAMRFKNPIEDLLSIDAERGLDVLHPAVWAYRDTERFDDRLHVGLYADDVEKMDPRCVVYDPDGQLKNYEDRCVIAYLVASQQAMKRDIAKLRGSK